VAEKHLLILIGAHLATAPRPQKEAAAARDAGFRVSIRGTWWNDRLAEEDLELAAAAGADFAPVVDLRPGRPGRTMARLRQRLAREAFSRLGVVTPRVFGLGAPELLGEATRLRADLTMVHSEAGLWVGQRLLARGLRVGVDFEDWFSQDLPPEARLGRPVAAMQRLERELLARARPVLTTTHALAEAMALDAGCPRIPEVIPNCFPWSEAPRPHEGQGPRDARAEGALSLYWFSQTIGPGRGLETLARALVGLEGEWQLHLRGELRGHGPWFEATFPPPLRARVVLQPTVPNRDLAAHSASHDVGLALEGTEVVSRDLTATNKIFEYLRCGLAVVATATTGQREVMAACPEAGWTLPSGDADALRQAIQRLLDAPELVARARTAARAAAAGPWAWETHRARLQALLESAAG